MAHYHSWADNFYALDLSVLNRVITITNPFLGETVYGFIGEWWERYWPQRGRFALLLHHHHLKPRSILSSGQ